MKRLLLLLLITGLSISAAWAQNVNIEQAAESREFENGFVFISDELSGIFTNSTFISGLQQLAVDANQVARINTEGDNNIATLTQIGTGNIGGINILGNGNKTSLNQNGTDLFSVLNIQGDFNILDVDQTGNDLQNFIDVTGTGVDFNITQDNAGIVLTQSGGTSIPLSIQKSGQTVPIIITNN